MTDMSTQEKRKCFTFIWTLENVSYYSKNRHESFKSPTFAINELHESKYHLDLYLAGQSDDNYIDIHLRGEGYGPSVIIDCEVALLSKDGTVLTSLKREQCGVFPDFCKFKEIKEVFATNKSTYLAEDKLRVRFRIWKNDGDMKENVHCFARSRVHIQKQSVLWKIQNFSNILTEEKCTYQMKSVYHKKVLINLDLFIKNPFTDEDSVNIQLVAGDSNINYFVLDIMPLIDFFPNFNKGIRKAFLFSKNEKQKLLTLPFSKKDLMANDKIFLPNDVLTLTCECTFSTGHIFEEIKKVIFGFENLPSIEPDNQCSAKTNTLSVSKRILNENLNSLFHENILPDIKLKTSSKTYLAHKSILSARSPVFKAMFSNDMKEKLNECVDIDDLESDAVYRMLHYAYTAEIQDLQWENACDLYKAADKYEILTLRDECSACLKSKLCPTNACDVLIFADTYQDVDLKTTVQDFIFEHDIISSDKWEQLMETHLMLAADTMRMQIQRKQIKNKYCTSTNVFDGTTASAPGIDFTPSLFQSDRPQSNFPEAAAFTAFQFANTTATGLFNFAAPTQIKKAVRRVPR